VGPVLGRFLTGLREARIEGVRARDGRVLVPPQEHDPATAEALDEWVPVGPGGVVVSWAWIAAPLPGQPLERPFAWALVRLDGADTALLHALDTGDPEQVRTGMRVTVRWRPERTGDIRDIECFVPEQPPVKRIDTPIALDYRYTPGLATSRFLRALAEGRVVGERCPACGKVYVPPRGSCPTDAVPTAEEVQLPDRGVVTTFCVVNVPMSEHAIEMPYVAASILLDGADIAFQHLLRGVPADQVRIGMRVRAEWRPRPEWGPTLESIACFRPEAG